MCVAWFIASSNLPGAIAHNRNENWTEMCGILHDQARCIIKLWEHYSGIIKIPSVNLSRKEDGLYVFEEDEANGSKISGLAFLLPNV